MEQLVRPLDGVMKHILDDLRGQVRIFESCCGITPKLPKMFSVEKFDEHIFLRLQLNSTFPSARSDARCPAALFLQGFSCGFKFLQADPDQHDDPVNKLWGTSMQHPGNRLELSIAVLPAERRFAETSKASAISPSWIHSAYAFARA